MELNLCEILKGHEGETFYSPTFSYVRLDIIDENYIGVVSDIDATSYKIWNNGTYSKHGEICIFPSKYQRDWSIWINEQKSKTTPKTWSELCKANLSKGLYASTGNDIKGVDCNDYSITTNTESLIEKSALAFLKIYQLIEIGYGGNISKEEWLTYDNVSFCIFCDDCDRFEIMGSNERQHLAFHTKEQAKEFLSHKENIQLLRDYFMI